MLEKFLEIIILTTGIIMTTYFTFKIIRTKHRNRKWRKTTATIISSKEIKVKTYSGIGASGARLNEITVTYLNNINKTINVELRSVNYKKSLLEINDVIPIVYNPLDKNQIQVICNFREYVIEYALIYFSLFLILIMLLFKIAP